MARRNRELAQRFDEDLEAGRAKSWDWEARADELRVLSQGFCSGYRAADWSGDELLALAALCNRAEKYDEEASACEQLLSKDRSLRGETKTAVLVARVRALMNAEKFEPARSAAIDVGKETVKTETALITVVGMYRDMALGFRERNYLEYAADAAESGYRIADRALRSELAKSRLYHEANRDRIQLAAIALAVYEQLGRSKDAEGIRNEAARFDFSGDPTLKIYFEAELARARLIGKPAAELVAQGWLGEGPKLLQNMRGQVVLLDFFAMWCGPCVAAFPHFREFQERFSARGFEIVGVTRFYGRSNAAEDLDRDQEWKALQEYARVNGLKYPVAVARIDDVANDERYSIASLPATVLIDRLGKIRAIRQGIGDYRKLGRRILSLIDEPIQK